MTTRNYQAATHGRRKLQRQSGSFLVEYGLAMILMAAAGVVGAKALTWYLDSQTASVAASHKTAVDRAAAAYIANHYGELVQATAGGPVTINLAAVRESGELPAAISLRSPLGKDYAIGVRRGGSTSGQTEILEALVVTSGGRPVATSLLTDIAAKLEGGGYVLDQAPDLAKGSMGSWQVQTGAFGLGAVGGGNVATALFFNDAAQLTDYLYRNAVDGRPEVNRMNTAIDMNANDVNNAGTVRAVDVHATSTLALTEADGTVKTGLYASEDGWLQVLNDTNVRTAGEIEGGEVSSLGRLRTGEFLALEGVATLGTECEKDGLVSQDGTGLLLSCRANVWQEAQGGNYPRYSWWSNELTRKPREIPGLAVPPDNPFSQLYSYCYVPNIQTGGCSCRNGEIAVLADMDHLTEPNGGPVQYSRVVKRTFECRPQTSP